MRNIINLLNEAEATQSVMVVVHPGSACGSANFNLGKSVANSERDFLAQDIANWREGILIINGTYSDELPQYPNLNMALNNAFTNAERAGKLAMRIFACDDATDGWEKYVGSVLSHIPRDTRIEITGIWYFDDDSAGCVNAVYDEAMALGFKAVDVRDSAIKDPVGDEEWGDDDEEDDELH